MPSDAESTKGWKSTLRSIRGFKQSRFLQEPAEKDNLVIEYRCGRFNQGGDVRNGEFADSLFRLMDQRGHLQPLDKKTANGSPHDSESSALRPAAVRDVAEEGGENQSKREWTLPMAVSLYRLVSGLVSRPIKRRDVTSNGHHHDHSSSPDY